jgi:DNA-binding response OmpR family regulator
VPHVVVLEGEPAAAHAFGALFAEAGYRASVLTDCAGAADALLALRPDLIVLDLHCDDGRCGLDVLRRLRKDPAGRDVPVLASPTIGRRDLGPHRAELGALGVIVLAEPFDVQDMLAAACAAIVQARGVRRRSDAALGRLRAAREKSPPT